jgi:hypothetical protein
MKSDPLHLDFLSKPTFRSWPLLLAVTVPSRLQSASVNASLNSQAKDNDQCRNNCLDCFLPGRISLSSRLRWNNAAQDLMSRCLRRPSIHTARHGKNISGTVSQDLAAGVNKAAEKHSGILGVKEFSNRRSSLSLP